MKFFTYVILVFIPFLSHAQKDYHRELIGKWEWVETTGGFGGLTLTPKTEGYTNSLIFKKGNSLFEYKNKQCHRSYTFKLEFVPMGGSEEMISLLKTTDKKSKEEQQFKINFTGQDTLYLTEMVHDGFSRMYIRRK